MHANFPNPKKVQGEDKANNYYSTEYRFERLKQNDRWSLNSTKLQIIDDDRYSEYIEKSQKFSKLTSKSLPFSDFI